MSEPENAAKGPSREALETPPNTRADTESARPKEARGRIGPFEVRARLSKSALGRVYLALDPQGREVAVAVPRTNKLAPEFASEARAAAARHRPQVSPDFEIGLDAGTSFIVFRFIDAPKSLGVKFPCTFCGRRIGVSEELLGKQVRCPRCKQVIVAPTRAGGSAALAPKSRYPRTAKFPCTFCGRGMGVPEELLGKQVRCPHCRQVIVALPARPLEPPPLLAPREEGTDGTLSEPNAPDAPAEPSPRDQGGSAPQVPSDPALAEILLPPEGGFSAPPASPRTDGPGAADERSSSVFEPEEPAAQVPIDPALSGTLPPEIPTDEPGAPVEQSGSSVLGPELLALQEQFEPPAPEIPATEPFAGAERADDIGAPNAPALDQEVSAPQAPADAILSENPADEPPVLVTEPLPPEVTDPTSAAIEPPPAPALEREEPVPQAPTDLTPSETPPAPETTEPPMSHADVSDVPDTANELPDPLALAREVPVLTEPIEPLLSPEICDNEPLTGAESAAVDTADAPTEQLSSPVLCQEFSALHAPSEPEIPVTEQAAGADTDSAGEPSDATAEPLVPSALGSDELSAVSEPSALVPSEMPVSEEFPSKTSAVSRTDEPSSPPELDPEVPAPQPPPDLSPSDLAELLPQEISVTESHTSADPVIHTVTDMPAAAVEPSAALALGREAAPALPAEAELSPEIPAEPPVSTDDSADIDRPPAPTDSPELGQTPSEPQALTEPLRPEIPFKPPSDVGGASATPEALGEPTGSPELGREHLRALQVLADLSEPAQSEPLPPEIGTDEQPLTGTSIAANTDETAEQPDSSVLDQEELAAQAHVDLSPSEPPPPEIPATEALVDVPDTIGARPDPSMSAEEEPAEPEAPAEPNVPPPSEIPSRPALSFSAPLEDPRAADIGARDARDEPPDSIVVCQDPTAQAPTAPPNSTPTKPPPPEIPATEALVGTGNADALGTPYETAEQPASTALDQDEPAPQPPRTSDESPPPEPAPQEVRTAGPAEQPGPGNPLSISIRYPLPSSAFTVSDFVGAKPAPDPIAQPETAGSDTAPTAPPSNAQLAPDSATASGESAESAPTVPTAATENSDRPSAKRTEPVVPTEPTERPNAPAPATTGTPIAVPKGLLLNSATLTEAPKLPPKGLAAVSSTGPRPVPAPGAPKAPARPINPYLEYLDLIGYSPARSSAPAPGPRTDPPAANRSGAPDEPRPAPASNPAGPTGTLPAAPSPSAPPARPVDPVPPRGLGSGVPPASLSDIMRKLTGESNKPVSKNSTGAREQSADEPVADAEPLTQPIEELAAAEPEQGFAEFAPKPARAQPPRRAPVRAQQQGWRPVLVALLMLGSALAGYALFLLTRGAR